MIKRLLKFSKYNDLSKIYIINNPERVYKQIPSPDQYYNAQYDTFRPIVHKNDGPFTNYSILGLDDDNNNSSSSSSSDSNSSDSKKATLIKFETGIIALKIPYSKLITLYNDEE